MKRTCTKIVTVVGTFPKNTLSCYCASNYSSFPKQHHESESSSRSTSSTSSKSYWIPPETSVLPKVFENKARIFPPWRRSPTSIVLTCSRRNYSSDRRNETWITDGVAHIDVNSRSNSSSQNCKQSSFHESSDAHVHDHNSCSISSPVSSSGALNCDDEIGTTTSNSTSNTTTKTKISTSNPSASSISSTIGLKTPFTPIRTVVTSQLLVEHNREASIMEQPKLLSKEEREQFMSVYHKLVKELLEIPDMKDMEETNRWMARVLQYNVPHGKKNRGLSTVLAYKYLAPEELTEENVQLSCILGWCVEILQAFFLVSDDIMDGSETRRGRPCWYKVDNLGLAAINDALLLESTIYKILKKHFSGRSCYGKVMEIMHDVTYKTVFGQSLDTRTGMERRMETYTMERYSSIVKYKTSYYSFYLPVALAMAMSNINDPKIIQQVRKVTLEMGHFFQVQDDYLDCFGNEEITGKIGTDIQDCKCSWLFVIAMQRCDPDQKKFLLENYGKHETDKVEAVKKLYRELELEEVYHNYEEQTYNMISTHIQQMNEELPKGLFFDVLHKIYKRSS